MDKKKYIEQELSIYLQSMGGALLLAGAGITILLSLLDYLVTPENFVKFLTYRIMSASLQVGLYFIFRLKRTALFQITVLFLGILAPAIMIELMVLSFGGHQSIYYAGFTILFMFILGFVPVSFNVTLAMGVMIYAIYLVPIIILDKITNVRIFINNNVFLTASAMTGLAWRYYNFTLLLKKLSLEYDLSQEKVQLEKYSTHLEDLVAERTKELHESEQWHRSIFENATDGIIVLDK